jgi:hypothetical protein
LTHQRHHCLWWMYLHYHLSLRLLTCHHSHCCLLHLSHQHPQHLLNKVNHPHQHLPHPLLQHCLIQTTRHLRRRLYRCPKVLRRWIKEHGRKHHHRYHH